VGPRKSVSNQAPRLLTPALNTVKIFRGNSVFQVKLLHSD